MIVRLCNDHHIESRDKFEASNQMLVALPIATKLIFQEETFQQLAKGDVLTLQNMVENQCNGCICCFWSRHMGTNLFDKVKKELDIIGKS